MITLNSGAMRVVIDPEHGGCLREVTFGEMPILRPALKRQTDPLLSACYPCVPYFGRVTEPVVRAGARHNLLPTYPKHFPHTPIHGEGWVSPWHATQHSNKHAELHVSAKSPSPGQFPFSWSAYQSIEVSDHGFAISLTLTNLDTEHALMGAGLHPFFNCDDTTTLSFAYGNAISPPGIETDKIQSHLFQEPSRLPTAMLDHSFEGLSSAILVHTPGRATLKISTNAPIAHIFHPAASDFVCIEPVSHLPGTLYTDHPKASAPIAPGASITLSMVVDITTQS